MLLGVLLALAAGTIVIYIVSQATNTGPQMTTVVVAAQTLNANTILVAQPQQGAQYVQISVAFKEISVPTESVPQDAFVWQGEQNLEATYNNYVVTGQFLAGDILRNKDPRLVQVGTGGSGSLTNIDPSRLHQNDVLMAVDLQTVAGGKPIAVAGDYVDLLATACNLPGAHTSSCESQTTLQSLYVYQVAGNTLILAVSHDTALKIMELKQVASTIEVVVRRPQDSGNNVSTHYVDPSAITSFGF